MRHEAYEQIIINKQAWNRKKKVMEKFAIKMYECE